MHRQRLRTSKNDYHNENDSASSERTRCFNVSLLFFLYITDFSRFSLPSLLLPYSIDNACNSYFSFFSHSPSPTNQHSPDNLDRSAHDSSKPVPTSPGGKRTSG